MMDLPPAAHDQSLLPRLRRERSWLLRRRLLANCINALGLLASLLLLLGALDFFMAWREPAALAAVSAAAVATLLFLVRGWLLCLGRLPGPHDLACRLEQAHPRFMDAMACAVELELRGGAANALEAALLEKVRAEVENLDFRTPLLSPELRGGRLAVLGMLFCLLTSAALHTRLLDKAGNRFADWRRGAASGLLVLPGNASAAAGSDIRVTADIRRGEDAAELVYEQGGKRFRFLMNRLGTGSHSFAFYGLEAPLRYRVLTPDLASPWFEIRVFAPPAILDATMRLRPPPYTGLPERELSGLQDTAAPAGSRVEIALKLTPGATAAAEDQPGGAVTMLEPPGATGLTTWAFTLDRERRFSFRLRSRGGHETRTGAYVLQALPDLPPVVEFLQPGRDIRARPDAVVPMLIRAGDDYGLDGVELVWAADGGARRSIPLLPAGGPGPGSKDETLDYSLNLAEVSAAGNAAVIACFARATDRCQPQAQSSRTEVFFIEIRPRVEPEESDMQGEKKEVNFAALIAETKRLIRLTWDTAGAEAHEKAELTARLVGALGDLALAIAKQVNELETAGLPPGSGLGGLLREAEAEIRAAGVLVSRQLLEPALPPQERALARLIAAEIELEKNSPAGKGEGEGDEGKQAEEQQQTGSQSPGEKQRQELAAMRQDIDRLRHNLVRQQGLNEAAEALRRDAAAAAASAPALASPQEEIAADTAKVAAGLEQRQAAPRAGAEAAAAAREMVAAGTAFRDNRAAAAETGGKRAAALLQSAIQELESAYRQQAAARLERLSRQAEAQAREQRQAAGQSREMAGQQPVPAAAEKAVAGQRGRNAAASALLEQIRQTAAEFSESYPDAAGKLQEAMAAANGLEGQMKRAENALLYKRFDRAAANQTEAANILQQLAGAVAGAAAELPRMSREDLEAALEQLRREEERLRQVRNNPEAPDAGARLEQSREHLQRQLDRLADELRTPQLRELADAAAMPSDMTGPGQGSARLLQITGAAGRILEGLALRAAVRRRLDLSRQQGRPPEPYRRQVEKYFKDLSEAE